MPFDASDFLKGLAAARDKVLDAARRATDVFGEQVIGDAQQLTPVLTGALQGSGTTLPAEIDGSDGISKTIGFNTDYAAAVHEVLTNHHPVGQAKFLETAMREGAPKYGPFVGQQLKAELG